MRRSWAIVRHDLRVLRSDPVFLVPSYWAMRGYRSTVLDDGGLAEVALPVTVLLAFAVGFSALAWMRFRVEETKVSWA